MGPRTPQRRRRESKRGGARDREEIESRFGPGTVLLVGNLKVGKSTIFSWYARGRRRHLVYPGTGVELAVGEFSAGPFGQIVDAPGLNSLLQRSEDAFVARDLLLRRKVGAVILVMDAKNPPRGLTLALQLAEFGVPVVVALNMADEARQRGVEVDAAGLARVLGVPVVTTMASEGRGLGQLKRAVAQASAVTVRLRHPDETREAAREIESLVAGSVPGGGLALMLLAGLPRTRGPLEGVLPPDTLRRLGALVPESGRDPPATDILLAEALQRQAEETARGVVRSRPVSRTTWADRLAVAARRPSTGIPLALLVLIGTYLFVGLFGAGFLVDLLEGKLFLGLVIPAIDDLVVQIPWSWLRELLTGPFGLLTVGLTLSLGIVMPVLATFFFAFALMEDSGYLPRLSLLLDRALRRIGLNGKGVLPLVMGFSCITMAVLTTRMLDTRKQRLIATLLLMLALPCAPLLSVMLVILGRLSIWATLVLFGVLFLQFALVGVLANHFIPGERADFVLELPPLRAPRLINILDKTWHRLLWFLKEAIPYFLAGSLILFLMDQVGALDWIREGLRPLSERFLGLPVQSADVFFMTVVRREAGAALLAQQLATGAYDGVQVVTTLLVMTLMIPCINSVLVMYKERGLVAGTAILLSVVIYSLLVGGLFHLACRTLGVDFA